MNESCDLRTEVTAKPKQAWRTFTNIQEICIRSNLNLQVKVRMIRCYIVPVLLYRYEIWTVNPQMEKRLEALEMPLYRRILKNILAQGVINDEVLNKLKKRRELLFNIKKRR